MEPILTLQDAKSECQLLVRQGIVDKNGVGTSSLANSAQKRAKRGGSMDVT
jgi:hypothetical protein